MLSFGVYGICVRSRWALRCVPVLRAGCADLVVDSEPASLLNRARAAPLGSPDGEGWFAYAEAGDGLLFLRWRGLFEFAVAPNGRLVVGRPLERATEESFETYLLSQVLSCALLRLGREPIHATALETSAGGVAVMADSGYGKSTLAAAFVAEGDRLVTDDLMLTEERPEGHVIYPGPSRLKLFPSDARKLLGDEVRGTPINDKTAKMVVPLPDSLVVSGPVPLSAIYVLRSPAHSSNRKRITIRRVSRRAAFVELTRASFNSIIVAPGRLRRQFAVASLLARDVPVKTLSYPRGIANLAAVRQAVLEDSPG